MMLDLDALSVALETHGHVARIVVAEARGSTPRDVGAAMLVWAQGQSGSIGGGHLEFQAVREARRMLDDGRETLVRKAALGPALNQCCGGAVTLVTETYDAERYRAMTGNFRFQGVWARALTPEAGPLPAVANRLIQRHEMANTPVPTTLSGGWLIEPVWRNRRQVFVYGAGHVGRALALVLAPIPAFDVFLVDVREALFDGLPDSINQSWRAVPTDVMTSADPDAFHLIMTPEHDYDLELCHHILGRSFGFAGLIGSQTKWVRFKSRLRNLGHSEAQISRICCPIGQPELGKHPQTIAVSVAATLLNEATAPTSAKRGASG